MTQAEVRRRLRVWQQRLGLATWQIEVVFDRDLQSEGSIAEVEHSKDYDAGQVRINPRWRSWGDKLWGDDIKQSPDLVLVHELLHLVMRDIDFSILWLPENMNHRDVEELIGRAYKHAQEGVIERLAVIIVAAYPSP